MSAPSHPHRDPTAPPGPSSRQLICRVGALRCALPLPVVVETMRPQPLSPLAGMPAFVRGASVIRGVATPVIDLGLLVAGAPAAVTRLVTVRAGDRVAALAVDEVIGIRTLAVAGARPPLLAEGGAVDTLAALDDELLVILRAATLVPDEVWAAIDAGAGDARPGGPGGTRGAR